MSKEKAVAGKEKGNKGGSEKSAITSPKKSIRPRGEKPNYDNKSETPVVDYCCHNVSQLLNGSFDNELYKIDNAIGMSKRMCPLYYGATKDILHIVADEIPTSHRLALAGVQPGTMIPFFQLQKPNFVSKSKDPVIHMAKKSLWDFLRKISEKEMPEGILGDKASSPSFTEEPEIQARGVDALKIIWEGKETERTFVEIDGVIFRIESKKIGEGAAYSYNVVYVHYAPYTETKEEDKIFDLSGSKTFLNVGKLQGRNFVPTQMLDDEGKEIQRRIWQFLRVRLEKAGFGEDAVEEKTSPVKCAHINCVDDKDMDFFWKKAGKNVNKEVAKAVNGLDAFWRVGENPTECVIFQIVRPKLNPEYILFPVAIGSKSALKGKVKPCRVITSKKGELPENAEMGKNESEKAVLRFIFDNGRAFMDAIYSNRVLLQEKLKVEKVTYLKKQMGKKLAEASVSSINTSSDASSVVEDDSGIGTKDLANETPQEDDKKKTVQMVIDSYIARGDHAGLAKFTESLSKNGAEEKIV